MLANLSEATLGSRGETNERTALQRHSTTENEATLHATASECALAHFEEELRQSEAGPPHAIGATDLWATVERGRRAHAADADNKNSSSSASLHSHRSLNRGALHAHEEQRRNLQAELDLIWPDPRQYNQRSLYLFPLQHPVRRGVIAAIEWKWWDRTVLCLIFLNTITLMLFDPFDIPALTPVSPKRNVMTALDTTFSALFLGECLAKILARGFIVGKHTYLHDAWNYLDLLVVMIGVLDFFPSDGSSSNLSALRSLRVMRPLRLVTKFQDLKDVVVVLISCIPDLSNAVGLVAFVLLVFGILGVQLFAGALRGVCFSVEDGQIRDRPSPCGFLQCHVGYECLQLGENPSRGVVTFDYIGASMMTVFQVMTYEGWNDVMYALQDSVHPMTYLYFLSIIIVGPIFALQLFLVVISNKYNSIKAEEAAVKARSQAASHEETESQLQKALTLESQIFETPEPEKQDPLIKGSCSMCGKDVYDHEARIEEGNAFTHEKCLGKIAGNGASRWGAQRQCSNVTVIATSGQSFGIDVPDANDEHDNDEHGNDPPNPGILKAHINRVVPEENMAESDNGNNGESAANLLTTVAKMKTRRVSLRSHKRKKSVWHRFRLRIAELAASEGLQDAVMYVICLNTLFMAADAHVNVCEDDNPDVWSFWQFRSEIFFNKAGDKSFMPVDSSVLSYKAVLEGSNLFFSIIFVMELLIKLVGFGPKKYFYSGGTSSLWNNFDLVVVILGISEFVSVFENTVCLATAQNCLAAEQCGSGNPFAVLRVFRLTRLGKLLRRFPDIYKQLAAIGKSMGAVLALMVLILLFLLIFTILGMNVFGGVMLMEFDAGEIMRGANVYVQLPWDPWNDQRPAQMPGRRGVIIDVDAEQHTNTPWKVEVWGSEGIAQELGLVSCNSVVNQAASADEVGCVWASDGGTALFNVGVITGIVPRLNFDTFFFSLITTFQVFTTANWNDDLYDVVSSSGSASSLYFYVLIVVGNWMLLNMMVAIIIQKFAEQRHQAVDAQLKEMKRHFVAHFGVLNKDQFNHELIHLFQKADADNSGVVEKLELQEMLTKDVKIVLPQNEFARLFNKYDTDKSGEIDFNEFMGLIQDVLNEAQQELEIEAGKLLPKTKTGVDTEVLFAMKAEKEEAADLTEEDQSKSLHCFAEAHPFRVVCSTITRHQWFERLILLCIVYSCVTMALDAPLLPKKHPLQPFLVTSDYVMNFIFITECVLKIVSQTLKQYLSSSWSRLDLIIVTVAIIDMILTAALSGNTAALAPLKTLRILRALRPLRLISRAEGLKVLISAMFSSVRPILGTVFIAMGVYSLLGLIGMQFLKGKMATCSDPKVKFMRDCWGLNQDGVERTWDNFPANFDVLPQAIVTMFTLATQDGWPTLMFAGMDSVGLTVQEVGSKYYNASGTGIHSEVETAFQNSSPVMFFFYWACIMVGGYIVMNMFVSVFVDGYLAAAEEMKALKEKNASDEKLKIPTTWDEPEGAVRVAISEAIIATEFDMFSALLILSNITLMAFESYKQAAWQTDLSAGSGLFFTIVFGWEALFKLYALNGARYFDSGWNKFDFFIVMISYAGLIIDNLGASVGLNPTLLRVLRIFRIFRILRAFRVFKAARGLQRIVASLAASLSSLANLGSILMLVFFIFSALATSLFGSVCVENEGGLPGLGAVRCALAGDNVVGLHSNFRHMGEAFGTLFRCSTSDAWRDILDSLAQSPADVMQPVSSLEWQRFSDLIGYDPFGLSQGDARYNAKLLSLGTARMEMAKISIRNWNASVYGMDNDPDWPTPESVPLAGEWLAMASRALPSCLSDNQVIELEGEGLMDCSYVTLDPTVYLLPTYRKGNRCQSTCAVGGDYAYLIASIFFAAFVVISNFVILQLVIAVLMDQMSNQDADPDGSHEHVPGSPDLRMHVFKRIYSRIHLNARRKLYREAFKKRQGHYPHKRQHSSKRDLEKELSDSATPPHAVASRLPSISATEA